MTSSSSSPSKGCNPDSSGGPPRRVSRNRFLEHKVAAGFPASKSVGIEAMAKQVTEKINGRNNPTDIKADPIDTAKRSVIYPTASINANAGVLQSLASTENGMPGELLLLRRNRIIEYSE